MSINFNEKSGVESPQIGTEPAPRRGEDALEREKRTGSRTRFVHKPNPMVERAYQIFEYNIDKSDYEPAGDYILINLAEPRDVTEKKLINLMSLLNGKKDDLIDMQNLTKSRLLYTIVPEAHTNGLTKIILKEYDGSGVSKDNAVFTIRKGVMHARIN